ARGGARHWTLASVPHDDPEWRARADERDRAGYRAWGAHAAGARRVESERVFLECLASRCLGGDALTRALSPWLVVLLLVAGACRASDPKIESKSDAGAPPPQ